MLWQKSLQLLIAKEMFYRLESVFWFAVFKKIDKGKSVWAVVHLYGSSFLWKRKYVASDRARRERFASETPYS